MLLTVLDRTLLPLTQLCLPRKVTKTSGGEWDLESVVATYLSWSSCPLTRTRTPSSSSHGPDPPSTRRHGTRWSPGGTGAVGVPVDDLFSVVTTHVAWGRTRGVVDVPYDDGPAAPDLGRHTRHRGLLETTPPRFPYGTSRPGPGSLPLREWNLDP